MALFKSLTMLADAPPQPNPGADIPLPIIKATANPTTPDSDDKPNHSNSPSPPLATALLAADPPATIPSAIPFPTHSRAAPIIS